MPATVDDSLWGTPSARHEAACASGSIAILAAMAESTAGLYDSSLVIGVEVEKTQSSTDAARTLGAAAWVGHEAEGVTHVWPHTFARVAEEYAARFGLDEAHLRAISAVNLAAAKRNPTAQTRGWDVPADLADPRPTGDRRASATLRPQPSPTVEPVCWCPIDGSATPDARPSSIADGDTTVGLLPRPSWPGRRQPLRHAVPCLAAPGHGTRRHDGTGLTGSVYDCFAPSEYLAIDIGLTGPGESWKAINGDMSWAVRPRSTPVVGSSAAGTFPCDRGPMPSTQRSRSATTRESQVEALASALSISAAAQRSSSAWSSAQPGDGPRQRLMRGPRMDTNSSGG